VTDPTTEPELEPLQPRGSGLAAKVTALGVVVIASAIVVTGLLGGRSTTSGQAAATVSPRPSPEAPAPAESPAEPLPILEVGAADAGVGRIVVVTGFGFGYVERASGRLETIDVEGDGYLVPAGPDGWLCVCEVRPWGSETVGRVVRLVRVGHEGRLGETVLERELTAVRGSSSDGEVLSVHAAMAPGGATAALGWVGRREDGSWRFEVELVRLRHDGVEGTVVVADLPARPAIQFAGEPFLAFDPSGAWLAVGLGVAQAAGSFTAPHWVIPLSGGHLGEPRPLADTPTIVQGGDDVWCDEAGWAATWVFAAICQDGDGDRQVRRWGPDGGELEPLALGPTFRVEGLGIRMATQSGSVIAWDPVGHRLTSVDAVDGQIRVYPRGGGPPDYPGEGTPPTDRSMLFGNPAAFAVAPGGDRVYAAGEATSMDGSTGADGAPVVRSTGIWVLDLTTRRIVDHWPATARYHQLAISPDGREVIAAGMAGFDADGRANPRQLHSITAFDAATGEVRLVAGELDGGGWVALP
jgi:hypothetical protein